MFRSIKNMVFKITKSNYCSFWLDIGESENCEYKDFIDEYAQTTPRVIKNRCIWCGKLKDK